MFVTIYAMDFVSVFLHLIIADKIYFNSPLLTPLCVNVQIYAHANDYTIFHMWDWCVEIILVI